MIHQISNYGDYIVSVDKNTYNNNAIGDLVELQLAIGKQKPKQYQIMAMYVKDNVGYFRVKDWEEATKNKDNRHTIYSV